MHRIMYPYDFGIDLLKVNEEILLKGIRLRDFHEMVKVGIDVYGTHSYNEVNALCKVGFFDTAEKRLDSKVLLVESNTEAIPEACFEVLLDVILNSYLLRFLQKHPNHPPLPPDISEKAEQQTNEVDMQTIQKWQLELISDGSTLLYNKRFALSLLRFGKSYLRTSYTDIILDCCSAIEAFFNFSKELKLRYTLAAFHYDKISPRHTSLTIKQMYELRNKIIHGKNVQHQLSFEFCINCLRAVHKILLTAISNKVVPSNEAVMHKIFDYYMNL